jgi:hypothetical protein
MLRRSFALTLGAAAVGAASSSSLQKPEVKLVRVPNGGIQPQAVTDGRGVVHLLYFAGEAKAGDLYYVRSGDNCVTWSPPMRVNSEPASAIALGTIRGGQIAVGRSGHVHVAWNGSSAVQSAGPLNSESGQRGVPMLYTRCNENRTGFEPERSLMTRTFGLDGGGALAADLEGNVYVVWHGKAPGAITGEAGRQVWIAASRDDGATFAAEKPAWTAPVGACGCCGMALDAGNNGTVRVLFRSATQGVHRDVYLLTSRDGGARFDGRKLHTWNINACPMSSMSFADAGGRILGAWETAGQVYFEDLAAADATPMAASGEGKMRKHPRLAIMSIGDALMTWAEGAGWQRGGSLAWQMFDRDGKSAGETRAGAGLPDWSFAAVVATPSGFTIIY